MSALNIISMLGGLALFLYGMRIMGDGLKQNNSSTLEKVLSKVTDNAFKSFLLGVLVTALIQSSTATIVLTAGLVGAGLLSLEQSIGIVLGANVGTTVTGQIIRLMDLDSGNGAAWLSFMKPATLAPVAAVVGIVLIMFIKIRNGDVIGQIAMGFGILFTGLINMTAAVDPLSESEAFIALMTRFSAKPVLGFLCGTIVSTILQSSSASVGMLQSLSATGVLSFSSVYPILAGIFLGDAATTAIMCFIGTRSDAKRTGLVTVLFNVFSVILVLLIVSILHSLGALRHIWDMSMSAGTIANANTVFKLGTALLCIPISGVFYKISMRLVRDEVKSGDIIFDAAMQKLDEKLFISPMLALADARKVLCVMQRMAVSNAVKALSLLENFKKDEAEAIAESEHCIDRLADAVDNYLIRFSSHVKSQEISDLQNYYLQCNSEVERIGDHAMNLVENAEELLKQKSQLTEDARKELNILSEAIEEILEYTFSCFEGDGTGEAALVEPLEEVIDDLVDTAKKHHINRLRGGGCNPYTGLVYVDILTNIERISDQCSNIAVYTLGRNNEEILHNHHDYLLKLHAGSDDFFNEEYNRQKARYLDRMQLDI